MALLRNVYILWESNMMQMLLVVCPLIMCMLCVYHRYSIFISIKLIHITYLCLYWTLPVSALWSTRSSHRVWKTWRKKKFWKSHGKSWNFEKSIKVMELRKSLGWVGLWGFLWWAPSAKGKDHHGVSSGWSSVWHRSNTGLSSTQYEQIPIILGIWPFWLTPFFFRSITFWRAYG